MVVTRAKSCDCIHDAYDLAVWVFWTINRIFVRESLDSDGKEERKQ